MGWYFLSHLNICSSEHAKNYCETVASLWQLIKHIQSVASYQLLIDDAISTTSNENFFVNSSLEAYKLIFNA